MLSSKYNSNSDNQKLYQLCQEKDQINKQLLKRLQQQEAQIAQLIELAEKKQTTKSISKQQYKQYLADGKYLIFKLQTQPQFLQVNQEMTLVKFNELNQKNIPLQNTTSTALNKGVLKELQTLTKSVKEIVMDDLDFNSGKFYEQQQERIRKLQQKLKKYEQNQALMTPITKNQANNQKSNKKTKTVFIRKQVPQF